MKKILTLLLTGFGIFGLASCGIITEEQITEGTTPTAIAIDEVTTTAVKSSIAAIDASNSGTSSMNMSLNTIETSTVFDIKDEILLTESLFNSFNKTGEEIQVIEELTNELDSSSMYTKKYKAIVPFNGVDIEGTLLIREETETTGLGFWFYTEDYSYNAAGEATLNNESGSSEFQGELENFDMKFKTFIGTTGNVYEGKTMLMYVDEDEVNGNTYDVSFFTTSVKIDNPLESTFGYIRAMIINNNETGLDKVYFTNEIGSTHWYIIEQTLVNNDYTLEVSKIPFGEMDKTNSTSTSVINITLDSVPTENSVVTVPNFTLTDASIEYNVNGGNITFNSESFFVEVIKLLS